MKIISPLIVALSLASGGVAGPQLEGGAASPPLDQEVLRRIAKEMEEKLRQITVARAGQPGAEPAWLRESSWSQVRKGMSPEEVRATLGDPAATRNVGEIEVWSYGRAGASGALRAEDVVGQVSFRDNLVAEANANLERLQAAAKAAGVRQAASPPVNGESGAAQPVSGAVTSELWKDARIWKNVREGMTPDEVRALLGAPSQELAAGPAVKQWIYGDVAKALGKSSVAQLMGSVEFTDGVVSGSACYEIPATATPQVAPSPSPGLTPPVPAPNTQAQTPPVEPETKIEPPPAGVPGYFLESRWAAVKPGVSANAVIALLGRPARTEGSRWLYCLDRQKVGGVDFMGGKATGQFHETALVRALEELSLSSTAAVPKWLNPKNWNELAVAEEADPKRGVPLAKVQELLGDPSAQHPGFGVGGGIVTERVYTVRDAKGSELSGVVAVNDFDETAYSSPPDWLRVLPLVRQLAKDAAAGPAWKDAERWRRLVWAVEAELQASWRSRLPNDWSGDLVSALQQMRIGESAMSETYLGGSPVIEWIQEANGIGGSERCAKVRFESGLTLLIGTGESEGAAPQRMEHPYLKRVIALPRVVVKQSQPRHRAWTDEQWNQIASQDAQRSGFELATWIYRLRQLAAARSRNLIVIARSFGTPDEVKLDPELGSLPSAPDSEGSDMRQVTVRYGEGTIVFMVRLRGIGVEAIQNDVGVLFSADPFVAGVSPPISVCNGPNAEGAGWPVFAAAAGDEISRWQLIEPGDGVKWVRRLLGEPRAIQASGPSASAPAKWTYGPWPEKRIHAGAIFVDGGVVVSGAEPPSE